MMRNDKILTPAVKKKTVDKLGEAFGCFSSMHDFDREFDSKYDAAKEAFKAGAKAMARLSQEIADGLVFTERQLLEEEH